MLYLHGFLGGRGDGETGGREDGGGGVGGGWFNFTRNRESIRIQS